MSMFVCKKAFQTTVVKGLVSAEEHSHWGTSVASSGLPLKFYNKEEKYRCAIQRGKK